MKLKFDLDFLAVDWDEESLINFSESLLGVKFTSSFYKKIRTHMVKPLLEKQKLAGTPNSKYWSPKKPAGLIFYKDGKMVSRLDLSDTGKQFKVSKNVECLLYTDKVCYVLTTFKKKS